MKASDRLEALAKLNNGKANEYGKFEKLGEVLEALFPNGITLNTYEDFNRFSIFVFMVNKISRVSGFLPSGVHKDSLDDVSIMSMMLRSYDESGHT